MPDEKISALTDGTTPADTDDFVVARSGLNFKLTWAALKATIGGSMPFNGGTITDPLTIQADDGEGDPLIVEAIPSIGGHLIAAQESGEIVISAQSASDTLGRIRLNAAGEVLISAQHTLTQINLAPDGTIGLGAAQNVGTTPDSYFFIEGLGVEPPDSSVPNSNMIIWFDRTPGAAKLMVKAKDSDGTVVTGSLALAP